MSTPRTLYDKIWDSHVVEEQEDGTVLLYIDCHLVLEVTSPQAFDGLRASGRKVRRPLATIAVADHNVPTTDRSAGIADPLSRHQVETLERNVVVGTGAAVMGALRVGEGARIGAGSVVVAEVPPNSVVVGVPGKVIYRDGKRVALQVDLEHADLPDPLTKAIEQMLDRIHALESEVQRLRRAVDAPVEPDARS